MSEKEYVLDEGARVRAKAELDAIEKVQVHAPACGLCGQRTDRLDRWGLCSKTSVSHAEHRAMTKAGEF